VLLAIDIGNTNIVIGIFGDDPLLLEERAPGELPGLIHHWRVSTVLERTADEYALLFTSLLALVGIPVLAGDRPQPGDPAQRITGVAISSSVPPLTGVIREMVARHFAVETVIVGHGVRTGMPIRYENPREVGPDRIVNAVAALDLYGAPTIVVDLGTATTFDVISAAGEYLGGAIVPGIEIALDALTSRAASLRRVELQEAPRHVIGRTTVESIQSGVIFGTAAMLDGLCERIEEEVGPSTIIATGGLGSIVVPHARRISAYEPWLTLHGLRLLYDRNIAYEERSRG
jgi:type III pantothenate kinase